MAAIKWTDTLEGAHLVLQPAEQSLAYEYVAEIADMDYNTLAYVRAPEHYEDPAFDDQFRQQVRSMLPDMLDYWGLVYICWDPDNRAEVETIEI